jgi:hypothetical protein
MLFPKQPMTVRIGERVFVSIDVLFVVNKTVFPSHRTRIVTGPSIAKETPGLHPLFQDTVQAQRTTPEPAAQPAT